MSDMIEQVAIALWIDEWDCASNFPGKRKAKDWPAKNPDVHRIWRRVARTAIKAMGEPTEEMRIAGCDAGGRLAQSLADKERTDDRTWAAAVVMGGDGRLYDAAYRAMIAAALSLADTGRQEIER